MASKMYFLILLGISRIDGRQPPAGDNAVLTPSIASTTPARATVREGGLRDGLQSIATEVSTAHRIDWINAAYAAGQREIEVGSFLPARLLPQLADTAEVLDHAKT